MDNLSGNIIKLKFEIPADVRLIAVSKTVSKDRILEAYNAGHKIFGENKVQELISKQPFLPGDIEWHFIGHLQTNKVKFITPFIYMIHSIESLKLLETVNSEAQKAGRTIKCLLQVHLGKEETKFGFLFSEVIDLLDNLSPYVFANVEICGFMGIASYTVDDRTVKDEFHKLKGFFDLIKNKYFSKNHCFKEISMGMSSDFKIAIAEGSTMIRIGSLIFGERKY